MTRRWLCYIAVSALAFGAAPAGAESPEENLKKIRERLAKVTGAGKVRAEMRAAEKAAEDAGTDPESGLRRNIVYDTSELLDSGTKEAIDNCINPPQSRRASYSVALIASDSRRDPLLNPGQKSPLADPRFVFDLDKYVETVIGEHAPPPRQEGRPGVRIVVDLVQEDWAYGLGPKWIPRGRAREYLDPKIDGLKPDLLTARADELVCGVVLKIENVLRKAGDRDIPTYIRAQMLRDEIDQVREKLDAAAEAFQGGADSEHGPLYSEGFEPAASEARRRLEEAESALESGAFDRVSAPVAGARSYTKEATEFAETLRGHQNELERHESRLEEARTDLWLRRVWWLPAGERVNGAFLEYAEAVDQYRSAVEGEQFEGRLEKRKELANERLDALESVRLRTASRFRTLVFYLPAGLFFVLGFAGFEFLRRRRKERRMAKFDWETVRSEWDRALTAARSRLDEIERAHPDLIGPAGVDALDDEEIEDIDLAYAMLERAESIVERADELAENQGPIGHDNFDRAHELLTEDSTTFRPANTTGDTAIRDRLQQTHEVRHERLPERLSSLIDATRRALESNSDADRYW